jgi:phenylacetate-CoA ligase
MRHMTSTAPGRLPDDTCDRDPIWDRELETATYEQAVERASAIWEKQFAYLMERSPYYGRKFREAGIGQTRVALKDMSRLPFSTKQELKHAIDEAPPFGSNLCVPPEAVKRVYQTSGTTGAPSVLALSRSDIKA